MCRFLFKESTATCIYCSVPGMPVLLSATTGTLFCGFLVG